MAELNQDAGSHKKGGKKRSKKMNPRVDLTPMVDLGFLLITFFMLATSLIKPQTMEITMPSDKKVDEEDKTVAKASQAISLILAKDNVVYYYFGKTEGAKLLKTDYSANGLRKILLGKNYDVAKQVEDLKSEKTKTHMNDDDYQKRLSEIKANKNAPVVRIMATDDANYKNLVDALDEMNICSISRYAVVNIEAPDQDLLKAQVPGNQLSKN
ncbi:MAG TPA: biopolymer transporter ExbD [Bacteroidales bacterium]|nr:biopolymer transporter ExbD [Bacteroidales bacterium]HPT01522.1 biopolymer transporter ExbD [Bacteroidales bacterium]